MIATYCLYLAVQIFQESWNPRNIKLMVLFMIKFINLLLCCFRNIFKCLSLRKVDTRYSEWKYITVNNNSNKVTTRNRLDFRLNPVPAESGPRRISGFFMSDSGSVSSKLAGYFNRKFPKIYPLFKSCILFVKIFDLNVLI